MTTQIKEFIEKEFYLFHKHPELSYQEFETTKRLKADLEAHGIEVLPLNLETGLVAKIGQGDKVVAIRADIDALPVQETTSLEYKSQVPGVMHACGHDSHAATILGAALFLKQREKDLKGTVKVIFQPAEEAPGGAHKIIDSGVLKDVRAIFGVHSSALFEVGTLGIKEGPICAAVERFKIVFTGKGSHGAHPESGNDAVIIGTNFVNAAQTIVSRNLPPYEQAVVSITHFEAGTTWNVIPETVLLEGTIRTYKKEVRALAKSRLEEIAKGIATTFNAKVELTWEVELPATINDKKLSDFAKDFALKEGFKVEPSPSSLGGEDFSLYQEILPGAYIQFGTGKTYPNHNPNFKVDPSAIYPTAKYIASLTEQYLKD